MALLLSTCLCLLSAVKTLRGKRGALTTKINLDDLLILLGVTAALTLAYELAYMPLILCLAAGIGIYGLLVWLDAAMFVQFRIEVNRQTISWFFTGSRGLRKGIPHLLAFFKKYFVSIFIPLLWICLMTSIVTSQYTFGLEELNNLAICAFLGLILTAFCAYYSEVGAFFSIILVSVFFTLLIDIQIINSETELLASWLLSGVFVTVTAVTLLLAMLRRLFKSQSEFLSSPTLLKNILAVDNFKADEKVTLNPEHEKFVTEGGKAQRKSELFGTCPKANIILITVESLGAYINPYIVDGVRSRLSEKLVNKSWFSKQHFCLCPNTTVSTNQIYTGGYSNNPYNKSDSLYPGKEPEHIKTLKREGYKTLFVDSANINLFDYKKLLNRIGFDRIWGTDDMPENGLKADYRLWDMVDVIAKEAEDGPFYLHLINDQTHMPYEVIDKARFSNHKGKSQKSVYLNALEEVDYILDVFLQKLSEKIDMSNTILVFTGDHGESFGEFGYSFHSNSVIMPQMQVPFMLYHPNLRPRQIEHSCHFDLFPTFFDLLGIEYGHQCIGNSLAIEDRPFEYFFHSATLKGNTPANFGSLHEGKMFWVDRLFNQVNILHQDQIKSNVNELEKEYVSSMLNRMLIQRGLAA